MHKGINSDEAAYYLPGSLTASSGPPLAGQPSNPHELPVEFLCCRDIRGRSLSLGFEPSEVVSFSSGLDSCSPLPIDMTDTLFGASRDCSSRDGVHAVLGRRSLSEICDPVIGRIPVGMINNAEVIYADAVCNGVDDAVNIYPAMSNHDLEATVPSGIPHHLSSKPGIPGLCSDFTYEVPDRPLPRDEEATPGINDETFVEVLDVHSNSSGSAVILLFPFPPRTAAAEWAWEEEASSSDLPPSIGELAVRIVGNLNMPRLVVFAAPEAWEEEGSGAYDRR